MCSLVCVSVALCVCVCVRARAHVCVCLRARACACVCVCASSVPGPWFLGGQTPSIVDLQYVSHVERMAPSGVLNRALSLK